MANPEVHKSKKALIDSAGKRAFYFPMVFIDGDLKLAGSAEYYEVLYALRQVITDEAQGESVAS